MSTSECPKCGRRCERSGELDVDGRMFDTFQCDECLRMLNIEGTEFEVALTWAVDEQGRKRDPNDPNETL